MTYLFLFFEALRSRYLFIPFFPPAFLQDFPVHLLTFISWTICIGKNYNSRFL